ncbi:hypothetical protein [Sphingomonas oryzagri]
MALRPTIDQLLASLRRARRRRQLRLFVAAYPLRVAILVLPMAAVTGIVAHAWIAAAGMILAGILGIAFWRRSLHIARIIVPTQWLAGAVESDLTRDGRAALTRLLLDAPVALDDATAWAEGERLRQHGRHAVADDPVPDRVH